MGIQLKYKTIQFYITLNKRIRIADNLTFVLRSVLGKELRSMCCVLRQKKCYECSLRYSCVYSWFFETPVPKDNLVAAGRDKATHPFVHSVLNDVGEETDTISYQITCIGKAVDYVPYIFFALQRAGKNGLFRERIPFHVTDVRYDDSSIYRSEDDIDMTCPPKIWRYKAVSESTSDHPEKREHDYTDSRTVTVKFITPFRLKKKGVYTSDVTPADIFISAQRRVASLIGLYGEKNENESRNGHNLEEDRFPSAAGIKIQPEDLDKRFHILEKKISWEDRSYYSGRQKQAMKLGGAAGHISWYGQMHPYECRLLEAAELFHIGKNVSFGLGKIEAEVEKRESENCS